MESLQNGAADGSKLDNTKRVLTVDGYLELVGQFGKMQLILQLIFCVLMLPATYQTLVMTFIGNAPGWQCATGQSDCNRTGTILMKDSFFNERCALPRHAWKHSESKSFSIVTQWDLVCKDKEYGIIANSAFFVGWAIGAVSLGIISDKYGRKTVLYPSFAMLLIAGMASSFVRDVWSFSFLRLLIGFFEGGVMLGIFVMATELVGPRFRALGGTLIWFAFTAALCLVALQAWLLLDWRKLMLVITVPYSVMLLTYRFVPESVRWLRIKNRLEDAEAILRGVAKTNRKPIPEAKLEPLVIESSGSLLDLFRPWNTLKMTLIQWIGWFINGMVYYGISLASDQLGGSLYRDFVLTSLVEIPGNILVIVCSNMFGRKPTVIITFFLSGLSCIGVALFPYGTADPKYVWSRVTLGMFGKLFITTSFNTFYIWSVELYPTVIRSQGMGCLSVVSRCGAAAAPWVSAWLSYYKPQLSFYLMGSLALFGSALCFFLPETKDKETLEVLATIRHVEEESLIAMKPLGADEKTSGHVQLTDFKETSSSGPSSTNSPEKEH